MQPVQHHPHPLSHGRILQVTSNGVGNNNNGGVDTSNNNNDSVDADDNATVKCWFEPPENIQEQGTESLNLDLIGIR